MSPGAIIARLQNGGAEQGWSVATMDRASEPAYAALVAGAPASPITHTLAWRDLLLGLELGQPIYWLARRDGQVRAALPAFLRRSSSGAVLNSLPLVQSVGGVITAADAGPEERAQAVGRLLGAMLAWAASNDVRVACVVGGPYRGLGDVAAFPRPPDFQLVRSTNVLDLARPLAPRASITWTIRKADRLGPVHRVARTPAEARAVYDLYAASMQRLGVTPQPWELFALLPQARFVWAEVGGEMVSALILLVHGQVIEYHSVGNSEAGRRLQTNTWLCAQELAWARSQGLRFWHWGVSPSPAVHDFKKRWGGEDLPFPVWGWCTGAVDHWRALTPPELAATFPSYFVLPYDQLRAP
ncbi:MAG TPA: GNAT family N-acetyltransferase [Polyangia bacterium]|nr:GNAT family N-acetyltransferase [Polyangia bacterium]